MSLSVDDCTCAVNARFDYRGLFDDFRDLLLSIKMRSIYVDKRNAYKKVLLLVKKRVMIKTAAVMIESASELTYCRSECSSSPCKHLFIERKDFKRKV